MPRHTTRESASWVLGWGIIYLVLVVTFCEHAPGAESASAFGSAPPVSGALATVYACENGSLEGEAGGQSRGHPVPLMPGSPVECEIAAGEKSYCRLTLTTGQYLFLSVEQHCIDVKIALYGPNGTKLAEADREHRKLGAERLWLIAPVSGDYLLEVLRLDMGATPGTYKAEISELRTATTEDAVRIPVLEEDYNAYCLVFLHTAESLKQGIEEFIKVADLWHGLGDLKREGACFYQLGEACNQLGEYEKAIAFLDRALTIREYVSDRGSEASVLTVKGESYYYVSRYQDALACYERSLELCQQVNGDVIGVVAWTLNNMGSVYDALGDKQRALDFYSRSLAIYQERERERGAGSEPRGIALTLTNIAGVYVSTGEPKAALDNLNRALPGWRAVEDRWGEARVLHRMGLAYAALGQYQEALKSYEQALDLWREQGDRFNEAKTVDAAGLAYGAQGDGSNALAFFARALDARRSLGDQQGGANTLYHMARAERDRGNLAESREDIEQAIEWAESVRSSVSNDELRSSYLGEVRDYYQLYIDLLMQLYRSNPSERLVASALEVSERGRARSLIELLAEGHIDVREGVDPNLVQRERSVERRLDERAAYQMRLLSHGRAADSAAAQKEIDVLTTDLLEIKARIRSASPHYAAITQPQPLTFGEIQREVVDPDTLLLEYALGDERSYVWAVTPTELHSFELPAKGEIEKAARRFYGLLTARNGQKVGETPGQRQAQIVRADAKLPEAARSLSQVLLGPIAPFLGTKRLLIVADGALQYVPFQCLQSLSADSTAGSTIEYRPLMIDHEIINLPSASTLAVIRREIAGRPAAPKSLAVLADPVFTRDDPRVRSRTNQSRSRETRSSASRDRGPAVNAPIAHSSEVDRSLRDVGVADNALRIPRLPLARAEAESILSLVPERERLGALSFDASKSAASDPKLAQYRIVHFATHGLLDSTHPELSGVVLSLVDRRGRPQDGFFRLHEIYNLKLPANLVVLSACQTGLGKEIKGEGLVGLTRGFMYAGAKSVVASLWKIDDRATSVLMKRFYQGMLGGAGLTPANALRQAQIQMWKTGNWSRPYYWAAFELQGEWK